MTWLISDEARKHRAFREVWVAYLLGGLYLLLGLYTEISEQNYSIRYPAEQKWYFLQSNIRSYGATLGVPDGRSGRDGGTWPPVHMEGENGIYGPLLRHRRFPYRRSQSAGKRRGVWLRGRLLPCYKLRIF